MGESGFAIEACIEGVRRRDESAARELLRHLYPLVLKLVRAHLPKRTSEDDLCQIIFVKVFANIDKYSGKVPIEHWVSRIAINTCLNQVQFEKIRPEVSWSDLTEQEAGVLQAVAMRSEEPQPLDTIASREVVDKLLGELNPQDRLVINLLHIEGYSLLEIAGITGWNTTLVKVRAFRARQKLKAAFNKLTTEGKL